MMCLTEIAAIKAEKMVQQQVQMYCQVIEVLSEVRARLHPMHASASNCIVLMLVGTTELVYTITL